MKGGSNAAKTNGHSATKHNNSSQFKPNVTQMAQRAKENGNSSNAVSDPVQMKKNSLGQPAFFQPNPILQARLRAGTVGDKFEKEADSVADKVVANQNTKTVSQAPSPPVQTMKVQQGDLQKQEMPKEEEAVQKAEENIQTKIPTSGSSDESSVQQNSNGQAITTPIQAKKDPPGDEELQKMEEEEPQAKLKERSIQKMEEEEPQAKLKDQSIQKMEEKEPVQAMTEEEPVQKMEEEEPVQAMTEEEPVQKMEEEEPVQAMTEEEPVQKMEEEEAAQAMTEEEPVQKMEEEEPVQAMTEEEPVQKMEEEEPVQSMSSEEDVQKDSASDNGSNVSGIQKQLKSSKGGGRPMDRKTLNAMQDSFGADFSGVRIHTDAQAIAMNQAIGAHAFTNGNDIYFNKGKYNPNSNAGKHLLAHELTHTLQQGASKPMVQKAAAQTETADAEKAPEEVKVQTSKDGTPKPSAAIDISNSFFVTSEWAKYLDALHADGLRKFEVDVKIGERYTGTILVRKDSATSEGQTSRYKLVNYGTQKYLDINGWSFMDPLRGIDIHPILVLNQFGEEQGTTGFLSFRTGDKPLLSNVNQFLKTINKNLEAISFLGITPLKTGAEIENVFESGRLAFNLSALTTVVDGYLEAGGGMGITGDVFTFNLEAAVNLEGLAEGNISIALGEDGKLSGAGDISASIANVQASIHVEYIDGVVTIQGTGKIESEKFSGSITLLVTDEKRAGDLMDAALGVTSMEEEEKVVAEPKVKNKKNQVLVGWGTITTNITPWLSGEASVGIDNLGHVTVVGEIEVDDEIELMEERGKKVDIFKYEIRAGYGIPLVGQVFLFASIGMFMNAGFGPLSLRNAKLEGTYSTDTTKLAHNYRNIRHQRICHSWIGSRSRCWINIIRPRCKSRGECNRRRRNSSICRSHANI